MNIPAGGFNQFQYGAQDAAAGKTVEQLVEETMSSTPIMIIVKSRKMEVMTSLIKTTFTALFTQQKKYFDSLAQIKENLVRIEELEKEINDLNDELNACMGVEIQNQALLDQIAQLNSDLAEREAELNALQHSTALLNQVVYVEVDTNDQIKKLKKKLIKDRIDEFKKRVTDVGAELIFFKKRVNSISERSGCKGSLESLAERFTSYFTSYTQPGQIQFSESDQALLILGIKRTINSITALSDIIHSQGKQIKLHCSGEPEGTEGTYFKDKDVRQSLKQIMARISTYNKLEKSELMKTCACIEHVQAMHMFIRDSFDPLKENPDAHIHYKNSFVYGDWKFKLIESHI